MSRNDFCIEPHENFGKRLRALVDAEGLSVEDFSKALKVHRDSPQKWFSGKSFPHRKFHRRIAELLNVPVNDLFFSMSAPSDGKDDSTKTGSSSELLGVYRELSQARKELNEQKDRIHELERALDAHRHRLMSDRRDGDAPEINPLDLRRPLSIGKNTAKPDSLGR